MKTDFEPETQALLDRVAPPPERGPDWDDVLARARPRRFTPRRILPTGLVLAVAVTAAWLFWPAHGSPSLVEQALAALGSQPVTHVVLERDDRLVDLRTGASRVVHEHDEIWHDPARGTAVRRSLRGQERTTSTRGLDAEGAANFLAVLADDYRRELATGEVHEIGSAKVDGTPVYVLRSAPKSGQAFQVSVSKQTFKPLTFSLVDGGGRAVPGTATRVVAIETVPRSQDPFRSDVAAAQPKVDTPYPPGVWRITLREAARRLGRKPLLPPGRIGGLAQVWTAKPLALVVPRGNPVTSYHPAGALLFFGRTTQYTDGLGDHATIPDFDARHVAITEYARFNPALAQAYGVGAAFPAGGSALLRGTTLTFRHDGIWIEIEASSRALALAAARALP